MIYVKKFHNTKLSSLAWHCVNHHNILMQENSSDCRVFMVMFAHCLPYMYKKPLNFSQQNIPSIRHHVNCTGVVVKKAN